MRLQIIAVGRLKAGPERDLVGRYLERAAALSRGLGFSGPDLAELPEGRGRRTVERTAEEAGAIRERVLPGAALVLLDESGPSLSSEAFAADLGRRRDAGAGALAFVIGGPDGADPALKASAAALLSFGRMTLPHGLVRIVLAEQLYRALTILAGHPYHRPAPESAKR